MANGKQQQAFRRMVSPSSWGSVTLLYCPILKTKVLQSSYWRYVYAYCH